MTHPDYSPFRWQMGVHGSRGADDWSRIAETNLVVGEYANDGGCAVFVGDLKGREASEFVILVDRRRELEGGLGMGS
jgi:hypothetical protein